MNARTLITADEIRSRFSHAMSDMYRDEVPQYGSLIDLVADINRTTLEQNPALASQLKNAGELERLSVERHGAIRVGTAQELSTLRRIFEVMGMRAVGYYDLSVAGVPVHSTAFRPIDDDALAINPFRVFTSLLRLDLIQDAALRDQAQAILAKRHIFTPKALELTDLAESQGGLTHEQADAFVAEVQETFRWHSQATVSHDTYQRLHDAHRLIADVVCFKGPHINHLTPRTLDIDAAQLEMPHRGIAAKEVVEGPPRRKHPILLRQTSFKALQERVQFVGDAPDAPGSHTARFGEIEQRGVALTREGRALYDRLLASVRDTDSQGSTGADYATRLAEAFAAFPDDLDVLRQSELAFFRYRITDIKAAPDAAGHIAGTAPDLERLIALGAVRADPIVYEDFLPVSAAGIFQSNLGGTEQRSYAAHAARAAFEADLGCAVLDEFSLYEAAQERSIDEVTEALSSVLR